MSTFSYYANDFVLWTRDVIRDIGYSIMGAFAELGRGGLSHGYRDREPMRTRWWASILGTGAPIGALTYVLLHSVVPPPILWALVLAAPLYVGIRDYRYETD
jgi:hypothetical protein